MIWITLFPQVYLISNDHYLWDMAVKEKKLIHSLEYLAFKWGGYFATHYEFKFENGQVHYQRWDGPAPFPEDPVSIKEVSFDAIEKFINAVNEFKILDWKRKYVDPGFCDGAQWELTIKYNEKEKKKCYGSNSYPNISGAPGFEVTMEFDMFLMALSRLVGRKNIFKD